MARVFNLSGTTNQAASFGPFTVPPGVKGIQGMLSAGPMPDPAQSFAGVIQVDRNDGSGFVDVGGLIGTGGLTSTTKGGPSDTPVTISATVYVQLEKGWKLRASSSVVGGPIAVTFTGDTF